jgi:Concanavalin A-like lectin/glucanases superfamily
MCRRSCVALAVGAVLVGLPVVCVASPPASSYRAVVLSDHPIAYYPLDETSGTVAHDVSGHHLDGHIGAHVKIGQPGLIPDGRASMEFSGANKSAAVEDVRIPGDPRFVRGTSVTIEAWAMPYTVRVFGKNSGDITIAAYGRDDAPDHQHCRYALELDAHSHLWHFPAVIEGKVTDPVRVTGLHSFLDWLRAPFAGPDLHARELYTAPGTDGNPPHVKALYHLVGTYDGETMRLYINGVLNNEMHVKGAISGYEPNSGMGIGGEFVDVNPVFRGRIAEVAVYDHVLSPDEIARHYSAGLAPLASR